jgi:hypothetical protein
VFKSKDDNNKREIKDGRMAINIFQNITNFEAKNYSLAGGIVD